jgi:phosphoadenosine phosphosulfate reductase
MTARALEPLAQPAVASQPAVSHYARASADYAEKLAASQAVLRKARQDHVSLVQASSLGAEDQVLSHLIGQLRLNVPMFVLDTGALHPETLALLDRTRVRQAQVVTVFRPAQQAVREFVQCEGEQAMYRSVELRKTCCAIRKLEPLERALDGQQAWITGLRREQSDQRSQVPLVDTSISGRVKYNPLAHWSWGDIWHYIACEGLDYNRLHDQFYPSIGCMPCTRAVSLGEDLRAGRWWWEHGPSKECGLHVNSLKNAHGHDERSH